MAELVIALNADGDARWYGLGDAGVGHLIMVGAGYHNDPLAFGPTLHKPCAASEKAKGLDAARLVEKFQGDKRCQRCVTWLASATGVSELEAARADKWAAENGTESLADVMGAHTLITLDGVTEIPAPDVREDSAPVIVTRDDVRSAVEAARTAPAPYFDQVTGKVDPVTRRAAAIKAERERLVRQKAARTERAARKAKGAEIREDSAPTLPGTDVVASTGKTMAQMATETAAYYANGGSVPAEIATLPDPTAPVPVRAWDVTDGKATESAVLVCEFHGPVTKINMERTHGKCPGCSTYIPLLPEAESKGPAAPKVSKERCANSGAAPASGTLVLRDDHSVSVADDHDGKTSAECPECTRVIAVSRDRNFRRHNGIIAPVVADGTESVDKIGKHNVGGVATPVTKGRLKDKAIELVEHGSVPGDPGDANARRADETRCPKSRKTLKDRETPGKVECPNEECGRTVELKARPTKDGVSYSIPEHTLPGEIVRTDGRNVTPSGSGADAGKGARDHGSVDGSAIVSAVNMAPVQPGGWLGHAGTGQLPAGLKSGIDPTVSGDWCPVCQDLKEIAHLGKSRGWRRSHSKAVGMVERDRAAKREAVKAEAIRTGQAIPSAERKALRKAAAVGSFAQGVNAHSGTVTHGARPVGRLGTGAYSSAK